VKVAGYQAAIIWAEKDMKSPQQNVYVRGQTCAENNLDQHPPADQAPWMNG
jgi:hypothetical protein